LDNEMQAPHDAAAQYATPTSSGDSCKADPPTAVDGLASAWAKPG